MLICHKPVQYRLREYVASDWMHFPSFQLTFKYHALNWAIARNHRMQVCNNKHTIKSIKSAFSLRVLIHQMDISSNRLKRQIDLMRSEESGTIICSNQSESLCLSGFVNFINPSCEFSSWLYFHKCKTVTTKAFSLKRNRVICF